MLKNGLLGIFSVIIGLVLIVGDFHFYVMIAGGAFIVLAHVFLLIFIREMIKKTVDFSQKKKAQKRIRENY
ncbi:hypothetical protein [Amphritea sp.]|uniref:hypothetical protein n=1 Tax=Amphritea sp. TaxID=1872502 RepID=UPI003D0B3734